VSGHHDVLGGGATIHISSVYLRVLRVLWVLCGERFIYFLGRGWNSQQSSPNARQEGRSRSALKPS
jgi:hypothetical protein